MRGPRVSLEQWRTLQAVVDCGGYAQAADFLHKSQSSVSYTVAKLQEQLGMPLLEIDGRKAKLTEAGEALVRRSRKLVEEAIDLEALAASLEQGWEPEISLAVDAAFPKTVLIKALKNFAPDSKHTRVQLKEVVLSGAEEELIEKKADLAIAPWAPQGFLGEPLLEIEFWPVAHPDHPIHKKDDGVSLEELSKEMQIVIRDSAVNRNRDSGWLGADQRWTVSSIDGAITLLQNGLGFAWVTAHDALEHIESGRLKVINMQPKQVKKGTMFLVYGHQGEQGPATQLLADTIKTTVDIQACGKLPSIDQFL